MGRVFLIFFLVLLSILLELRHAEGNKKLLMEKIKERKPNEIEKIINKEATVDAWRFLSGITLTNVSARHMLMGMMGMAVTGSKMAETVVKGFFKNKMTLTSETSASLKKTLRNMVDLEHCYKIVFPHQIVGVNDVIFMASDYNSLDSKVKKLLNLVTSSDPINVKKKNEFVSTITNMDTKIEKIKSAMNPIWTGGEDVLTDPKYKRSINYIMFLYYRSLFLHSIKFSLNDNDGNIDKDEFKKEKNFVEDVKDKTRVDKIPSKRTRDDVAEDTTPQGITITKNGKKNVIANSQAGKFVIDTMVTMKEELDEAITYVSSSDFQSTRLDKYFRNIMESIKTASRVYFELYRYQKEFMTQYSQSKESMITGLDAIEKVMMNEADNIDIEDDIVEESAVYIDVTHRIYPKLRAAYYGNADDKNTFKLEYESQNGTVAATFINNAVNQIANGAAGIRPLLRFYVPLKVLASFQGNAYCRFSRSCNFKK